MAPLVSVVIPTLNRAEFLEEAVHSVLSQTVLDLELIIVDGQSVDETPDIAKNFERLDARVKFVLQEGRGRSDARNEGIRLSRGTFIGILDSDDVYMPTAIENHLGVLSRHPDVGMTVGGYQTVDEAGRVVAERRPWTEGGSLDLGGWLYNCFALPGAVLLRREWFFKAGGYDTAIDGADDWDHFLQLALHSCPMAWVKETVCHYRQHAGGSIQSGGILSHRKGIDRAFEKLADSPLLPAQFAADIERAKGWALVQVAKMYYSAGADDLAREELRHALRLNPDFSGHDRLELLEHLLAETAPRSHERADLSAHESVRRFPGELGVTPADLRRAIGRVEMAQYFRAQDDDRSRVAWRHLKAGLFSDPSWLANRGVLVSILRHVLGQAAAFGRKGRASEEPKAQHA